MKLYFKFIFIFILLICPTIKAEEKIISQSTNLFETENLTQKIVTIISETQIKIIKKTKQSAKIEIVFEPYKKDRRNRKGTIGYISNTDLQNNTIPMVTLDSLFDSKKNPTKDTFHEVNDNFEKGIEVQLSCASKQFEEGEDNIDDETIKDDSPNKLSGCDELKKLGQHSMTLNEEKLNKCIDSIIELGKKGAEIEGNYLGIGKMKMPKISRNKFFSNLINKLRPVELDFIGHILTTSGEAYGLTMIERLNDPKYPPHLQEMMAISMVLENRKLDTINKAKWYNEEMKNLKIKYQLSSTTANTVIYSKMKGEISIIQTEKKELEEKSKRLKTDAEVALYRNKINEKRNQLMEKTKYLSKLMSLKNLKENITTLDIALEGNGVQFSMYSNSMPNTEEVPNYPHWYKTISGDFKKARETSVKSFIKYQKIKKSLPTDVVNYYSTILKKPPNWANSQNLKLTTITVMDNQKNLKLNTDPAFTNLRNGNGTYKCGVTRTETIEQAKVGHCFYAGNYQFFGHNFGS